MDNNRARAVDPQTGQEFLLSNTRKQIKCNNPVSAWIQVTGDVHSNTAISFPGGL